MDKNVILIGLGPHAKRIYIALFKKYNIEPKVIVDLRKKEEELKLFLSKNNISSKLYLIDDKDADNLELSSVVQNDLKKIINEENIKYAIISTEPKSHFAYSKFLIALNINILMDKPITAPIDAINNINQSKKIETEYLELCNLYKKHYDKMKFVIQCQRRFHKGYNYVKDLISEVVNKYGIPVTYIDIYHCDGMWNMPDEFFYRENHPYKYGYGKLFHSGYHFVDLLSWLIKCNDNIGKDIDNVSLYTTTYRPKDFMNNIDNNFYHNYMNTNKFDKIFNEKNLVNDFGELDIHAIMDFKKGNDIITNCSFNLMQSGYSRRSWVELPIDTYKSNGRVRHERINIQVGPLMNVQIHSYQAQEINDQRKINEYDVGGLNHFDIYIFRNEKIIAGKPFEKISIKDLTMKSETEFLGNNEKARERCFYNFLFTEKRTSDLLEHQKSILLLEKMCEAIASNKGKINFDWKDYYEK